MGPCPAAGDVQMNSGPCYIASVLSATRVKVGFYKKKLKFSLSITVTLLSVGPSQSVQQFPHLNIRRECLRSFLPPLDPLSQSYSHCSLQPIGPQRQSTTAEMSLSHHPVFANCHTADTLPNTHSSTEELVFQLCGVSISQKNKSNKTRIK